MQRQRPHHDKYCLQLPNEFLLLTDKTIKRSFAEDPVQITWIDDEKYWEKRHRTNESEFGYVAKLKRVYWLQVAVSKDDVPAGRYLAYARIKCFGKTFFGNWRAGAGSQYKKVNEPYEAEDETEAVTRTEMDDPDLLINEWVYVLIGTFQLTTKGTVGISLFGNNTQGTPSILFDHGGLIPCRNVADLKDAVKRAKITLVGPGRAGKTCLANCFLNLPFEDTASTQGIEDMGLQRIIHNAAADDGNWEKYKESENMYEANLASHIRKQPVIPQSADTSSGIVPPERQSADTSSGIVPPERDFDSSSDPRATCSTGFNCCFGSFASWRLRSNIWNPRAVANLREHSSPSSPIHTADLSFEPDPYFYRSFGEIEDKRSGIVVSIHDFGGQRVFDVIHSFFLSPNSVYVVVFNMQWIMPSSTEKTKYQEYLHSWVNALVVHTCIIGEGGSPKCASIALVGTHKDSVENKEIHQKISEDLRNLLRKSIAWQSVLENKIERLCFFPVNCKIGQGDPSLNNLKKTIEEDLIHSPSVNALRPLNYFHVLDKINDRKKTDFYLSLDEVLDMAAKSKICDQPTKENMHPVGEMLRFFHSLGLIMWHEESALREFVILDPVEFFVSAATNVVCQHKKDEQGTRHTNPLLEDAEKQFPRKFVKLTNDGIVEVDLLQFILKGHMKLKLKGIEHLGGDISTDEVIEAILFLMKKYSLIVPMFNDFEKDEVSNELPREYLVPSLLPTVPSLPPTDSIIHSRQSNEKTLYLHCSILGSNDIVCTWKDIEERGFLPPGLFQRYIAKLLTEIDGTRGGNYSFKHKDQAWLYIGQTKFTFTAIITMGSIRVDLTGDAIYGPLKLMKVVMKETADACFRQLNVAIMAPLPPSGTGLGGLINLNLLKKQEHNFESADQQTFNVKTMKESYSPFLYSKMGAHSFDVFISYRWAADKKVSRILYDRLDGTVVPGENNRNLHVYLDVMENGIGDNFALKIWSAFQNLKFFVPLISTGMLERVRKHDPNEVDYVLAEWMLALKMLDEEKLKILPILVGEVTKGETGWKALDAEKAKRGLPSRYPRATVDFMTKLEGVEATWFLDTSKWTVDRVVERMFTNVFKQWSEKSCVRECQDKILGKPSDLKQ